MRNILKIISIAVILILVIGTVSTATTAFAQEQRGIRSALGTERCPLSEKSATSFRIHENLPLLAYQENSSPILWGIRSFLLITLPLIACLVAAMVVMGGLLTLASATEI